MDGFRPNLPGSRRFGIFASVAAGLLAAGQAHAVTVQNLKGMRLEALYGRYAPGGDCRRKPVVTVTEAGFGFDTGTGILRTGKFEYAVSYGPRNYAGISFWFFPFIGNHDDLGPLLMTFNADEKRGKLAMDSNLAPGQRLPPAMAVLAKASPYSRCSAG